MKVEYPIYTHRGRAYPPIFNTISVDENDYWKSVDDFMLYFCNIYGDNLKIENIIDMRCEIKTAIETKKIIKSIWELYTNFYIDKNINSLVSDLYEWNDYRAKTCEEQSELLKLEYKKICQRNDLFVKQNVTEIYLKLDALIDELIIQKKEAQRAAKKKYYEKRKLELNSIKSPKELLTEEQKEERLTELKKASNKRYYEKKMLSKGKKGRQLLTDEEKIENRKKVNQAYYEKRKLLKLQEEEKEKNFEIKLEAESVII